MSTPTSASNNKLSAQEILNRIDYLAKHERKYLVLFLQYINQVEEREIYLQLGHSSMFEFCRTRLKLSESETAKRIRTARCLWCYPIIAEMLTSGEVNVTTISLISKFINQSNYLTLLREISRKTTREVQKLVYLLTVNTSAPPTAISPGHFYRDKDSIKIVTPMPELKHTAKKEPNSELKLSIEKFTDRAISADQVLSSVLSGSLAENSNERPSSAEPHNNNEIVQNSTTATLSDNHTPIYQFKFYADEIFLSKIEQSRSLLSSKYPCSATLEQILTEALDLLIGRLSPAARNARRLAKTNPRTSSQSLTKKRSRYIPRQTRDEIYLRDGGQCTYTSPDGVRCLSTHDIEIHHDFAFAKGGEHSLQNLRLLCRAHNVFMAERELNNANRIEELNALKDRKNLPLKNQAR